MRCVRCVRCVRDPLPLAFDSMSAIAGSSTQNLERSSKVVRPSGSPCTASISNAIGWPAARAANDFRICHRNANPISCGIHSGLFVVIRELRGLTLQASGGQALEGSQTAFSFGISESGYWGNGHGMCFQGPKRPR